MKKTADLERKAAGIKLILSKVLYFMHTPVKTYIAETGVLASLNTLLASPEAVAALVNTVTGIHPALTTVCCDTLYAALINFPWPA